MVRPVSYPKPAAVTDPTRESAAPQRRADGRFDAVLRKALQGEGLRFSRHAVERMEQRRIRLGADQLARIQGAVERAARKGARDSLVVLDRHAFIVSVRNRTVVTALDPETLRDQVVTQIDSAMIL